MLNRSGIGRGPEGLVGLSRRSRRGGLGVGPRRGLGLGRRPGPERFRSLPDQSLMSSPGISEEWGPCEHDSECRPGEPAGRRQGRLARRACGVWSGGESAGPTRTDASGVRTSRSTPPPTVSRPRVRRVVGVQFPPEARHPVVQLQGVEPHLPPVGAVTARQVEAGFDAGADPVDLAAPSRSHRDSSRRKPGSRRNRDRPEGEPTHSRRCSSSRPRASTFACSATRSALSQPRARRRASICPSMREVRPLHSRSFSTSTPARPLGRPEVDIHITLISILVGEERKDQYLPRRSLGGGRRRPGARRASHGRPPPPGATRPGAGPRRRAPPWLPCSRPWSRRTPRRPGRRAPPRSCPRS